VAKLFTFYDIEFKVLSAVLSAVAEL